MLDLVQREFEVNVPLAIAYVARAVPIDSEIAMNEYAPVQTRVFDASPRVPA